MAQKFYHNITRNLLNETDVLDFMDVYEEGDSIYITESGSALVQAIGDEMLAEFKKETGYSEEDTER